MATENGKCAYCSELGSLRKSHAIPDALIRELKKTSGGSLRQIEQDRATRSTSGSGYAYLLCGGCESRFNELWDKKAISTIRKLTGGTGKNNFDHNIIAAFICSVLWRADLSPAAMYSGYRITDVDKELLANVVHQKTEPFDSFSFEISELVDESEFLSESHVKRSISAPYRAAIIIGSNRHIVHHFSISGLFFAAILPKVPIIVHDQRYLLRNGEFLKLAKRDLSTLSNFRNIEVAARTEAMRAKWRPVSDTKSRPGY